MKGAFIVAADRVRQVPLYRGSLYNIYIGWVLSLKTVPKTASVSWQHEINRYANQHSATYIVLLSAYEVVDING